MNVLGQFLNTRMFFWALLCLPAIPMLIALGGSDPQTVQRLLHPTGEFAARFMILAMIATPLTLLLPGWRGPRWLARRRHYLGVAAFGYAALHTVLYLIEESSAQAVLSDATRAAIWTGWLAFVIFIPLAITSTNGWVRRLGPNWKTLQRWVYGAALLTLVHWLLVAQGPGGALVHFAPLVALEAYRIWWSTARTQQQMPQT